MIINIAAKLGPLLLQKDRGEKNFWNVLDAEEPHSAGSDSIKYVECIQGIKHIPLLGLQNFEHAGMRKPSRNPAPLTSFFH